MSGNPEEVLILKRVARPFLRNGNLNFRESR